MNIRFFFQLGDWNRFTAIRSFFIYHFLYFYKKISKFYRNIKKKIKIRVVINHLKYYLGTYTYVYMFIFPPFWSFDGKIPLLTQHSQLHLLEQLPLSLCTYPFSRFRNLYFFSENRIWLRIAHF